MLRATRFALALAGLCLGLVASAQEAALDESVATVSLARGTDLNLVVSKKPGSKPTTAALLFPGYPGVLRVEAQASGAPEFQLRGNFLVRARRHLVSDSVMTVLVDCPKDRWTNCDDSYRESDQYAVDVAAAIDKLKAQQGVSKIYLIGTSYGTVSTAFLARKLDGRIDGAVHTSTFTDPRAGRGRGPAHGLAMWDFDWTATHVDQLFVHHQDDPCPLTQYRTIAARHGSIPLITVQGAKGVRGEPCEAFSQHGFAGRERPVMLAIGDWIATRKVAETVGTKGDE
ncbi:serine aminopeptidase domain-containing protein [Cupriavidus pauculus]|uniref:Alpha/beta hydrolase n=1 Tax=Cupriavidus pauculus TaxID=82633 RepID=A0A2N5CHE0_9BURK|nr:alpha/beta hydrolase [Cupriavidus pauculus]PLQ01585.1 alpha/beta hydrolase [Cupriavidus pauculus]